MGSDSVQVVNDKMTKSTTVGWNIHLLEIVSLLYFTGYLYNEMITIQFLYWRVQEDFFKENNITLTNTSDSVCESTPTDNHTTAVLEQIQETASNWQLYVSLAGGLLPIFTTVFLGSLSDKFGRKFLFILPSIGALVRSFIYFAVSYWYLSLNLLIIAHVIEAVTGGFLTVLLASFAATSDSTGRGKRRSLQITIMESIMGFAIGISNITLGFMINSWGYSVPNIPPIVLVLLAIVLTIFCVSETNTRGSGQTYTLKDSLKRVYGFYFSDKNDNPRTIYIICILTLALASLAFVGTAGIETLYVMNEPLCWGSVKIGYFGATRAMSQALGTVVVVKLLQYILSDIGIAILSGLLKASAFVLEGFATTDPFMYIVAVITLSGGATLSMIRSTMSKMTPADKLGSMFASVASMEAVTNLLGGIVFTALYKATLPLYRGMVFFFVALVVLGSVGLNILLYLKLRQRKKKDKTLRPVD